MFSISGHGYIKQRAIIRRGERLIQHRAEVLLKDFPPLDLCQHDRPDQDTPPRVLATRLLGCEVAQACIDALPAHLKLLELAARRLNLGIDRLCRGHDLSRLGDQSECEAVIAFRAYGLHCRGGDARFGRERVYESACAVGTRI